MTLIAGFSKDDCPILVGDLLISTSLDMDKEITFPTIGKISREYLAKAKDKPAGFCQKINLLSPKLAIGWAGSKIEAQCFVRELMEANLHLAPSYDLLQKLYNEVRGNGDLSIIGIYRDGKQMRLFDFNAYPVDVVGTQYFKAAGSGYGALLELAAKPQEATISGQLNKLEKGIATAVSISTALLVKEILTTIPLENVYGAGYEILHPLGSDLAKYSDLTYLFWRAEEEVKGEWKLLPFPFLASKYSYYKDILVIRTVRLSSGSNINSSKIDSDELHAISPLYRQMTNDELIGYAPPSLNSKRLCNMFLWKNCAGNTGALASYGQYTDATLPIIWSNEFTNNEGVNINKQFIENSLSKIALDNSANHNIGDGPIISTN